MKALEVDWLALEPAVEDVTVLQPAKAVSATAALNRYTYFRIDTFDHTHDIIVHLNTSSSSPKFVASSPSSSRTSPRPPR